MLDAGLILSLALLAGRLAGLLRELTLAAMFGVGPNADAAVVLLTLPDLLVNLLLSGGLSAALVPRMSGATAHDAQALLRRVSLAVLALFGILGLVVVVWPQAVFQVLAPGMTLPFSSSAAALVAVALAVPLTGASGVAGAYLNANNRYFVTGCGTLIFNVGVLVFLFVPTTPDQKLSWLAYGIAIGAILRWTAQLVIIPRRAWYARPSDAVIDCSLLQAFTIATVASAMMLLAPVLVRAMASTLAAGTIASFNYSQKLVELPVAILITSISTVSLSRLSALHAKRQSDQAAAVTLRDTQYAVLIACAVTMIGCWFADSVVRAVFGYGQMHSDGLARITVLTKVALLGVPSVAISSMAMAYLNATGRTQQLFKPTLSALIVLPLLAAPGLYFSSELGLMGAVVAFNNVLAFLLARLAGLHFFGSTGVFGRTIWPPLLAVAVAVILAGALDTLAGLQNHWLRLAIAGGGFSLALVVIRRFLLARPLPQIIIAS